METPLRTELRKCFIEAIKPTEAEKKPQRKQRINTIHYGEALTSDEVLERLKEEEMEKKKRRDEKQRGRKKGTRKRTRTQTTSSTIDLIAAAPTPVAPSLTVLFKNPSFLTSNRDLTDSISRVVTAAVLK